jgi:hypothetical protein
VHQAGTQPFHGSGSFVTEAGLALNDENERAATKIQARYRGERSRSPRKSPSRQEYVSPYAQRSPGRDNTEEHRRAATKIQARYRGERSRSPPNKRGAPEAGVRPTHAHATQPAGAPPAGQPRSPRLTLVRTNSGRIDTVALTTEAFGRQVRAAVGEVNSSMMAKWAAAMGGCMGERVSLQVNPWSMEVIGPSIVGDAAACMDLIGGLWRGFVFTSVENDSFEEHEYSAEGVQSVIVRQVYCGYDRSKGGRDSDVEVSTARVRPCPRAPAHAAWPNAIAQCALSMHLICGPRR